MLLQWYTFMIRIMQDHIKQITRGDLALLHVARFYLVNIRSSTGWLRESDGLELGST
jgi:hypothetical protein